MIKKTYTSVTLAALASLAASSVAIDVSTRSKPTLSILVDTFGSNKYQITGQSDKDAKHNRRLSKLIEERRNIGRFTKGDPANDICWDREGVDAFTSPIDVHNHFRAFEGPNVPYDEYMEWMMDHGILFSVAMGLGQRIVKSNPEDPDCCYYLHCPTFNYTVTPSTTSDIKNAEFFTTKYQDNYKDKVFLVLSATYPDLQIPDENLAFLDGLETAFPDAISWVGEVNLVKHALAANGFFNNPTVTEAKITSKDSALYAFFERVQTNGWPITIHADLGCDNFDGVPGWEDRCIIQDMDLATASAEWYNNTLGMHYSAFFEESNGVVTPKPNFRKIQYLKIFDTILSTFPDMKVVWAHTGLSKELITLHPAVHSDIMEKMFKLHPNLYTDVSWDILVQLYLMNYDPATDSLENFKKAARASEDISPQAAQDFKWDKIDALQSELAERWNHHSGKVEMFGSAKKVTGPTYDMAIYMNTLYDYPDRFLTGTDFVSSLGPAQEWPGLSEYKDPPTGCMKTKASHARQLTDTSTINIMLSDDAFQKIVLGENFFRILGMTGRFQAPSVCTTSESPSPNPNPATGLIVSISKVMVLSLVTLAVLLL